MAYTEIVTTQDGTDYEIKTRLSWADALRVDGAGERMLVYLEDEVFGSIDEAKDVLGDDFKGELKFEMVLDKEEKARVRLESRLVGLSKKQIAQIPYIHVMQILARIIELEQAEKKAISELIAGNPTTTPSLIT